MNAIASKTKVDEIVKDVQVKVDKFSFPADMTVKKMTDYQDCPLLLGRSFLATSQAVMDLQKGRTVIISNGDSQTYKFDTNIEGQPSKGT